MSPKPYLPPFVSYVRGQLCAGDVPLEQIANDIGTPCFVYQTRTIDAAYQEMTRALSFRHHMIAYALKANSTLGVLRHLKALGAGADIVSGGELARALYAGFPNERIVFSGVGKTEAELVSAIQARIHAIHVESEAELYTVSRLAKQLHTTVPIALRVNPDIDAVTHPYISTGLHSTKFGIDTDLARRLLPFILSESGALELRTLACHIGSQLSSPEPLRDAVEVVARLASEFVAAGAPIRAIDAGGGWPIGYGDEAHPYPGFQAFGQAIEEGLLRGGAQNMPLDIQVEPGRSLVGQAGILLTRVILLKQQQQKHFVVVDAAMTELLRPALYQAHHTIVSAKEPLTKEPWTVSDVVGPVCETADFLALDRPLPPLAEGDVLAVTNAGAYAASMASNYNSRLRPAEVLVTDHGIDVIRRRESYDDLWRLET
ncbi:MAG: diaminopimelate decarboxylase [Myxococcales bacterium]|nr:diaminopimelate decarboxylase [Myxococcales bacterium]MCB9708007.1 diaminopimelate decarboxylase [Myxococcales bacterium]